MKKFNGKVAFVTGAASGMGEALTKQLCSLGAIVIATDINEAGLRATHSQAQGAGSVHCFYQDVTDQPAFDALLAKAVEDHHQLDYIFNNAGIAIIGEARDQSLEDWQRTLDINLNGVMYGTYAAYQIMCTQGYGHIVNTASAAGLMPVPFFSAYSMTKHAVVGLTLSLREEAKAHGVRLSAVCPGVVQTNIAGADLMEKFHLEGDDPFEFMKRKTKTTPVSAEAAANHILRGVSKNKAEIIFPLSGKLMVTSYHRTRKIWEGICQSGLKLARRA